MIRFIKSGLFRLSPRHHSNHRWYGYYKERALERALRSEFKAEQLSRGYGRWLDERLVEYPWALSRLAESSTDLLDAGSTLNHRLILHHPRLRNKNITVFTLAPEPECFWYERVSYVFADLRNMYFRDRSFSTVICISVLEHVGLDTRIYDPARAVRERDPEAYLAAVAEMHRVLKPGGSCLITVPFGKYQLRSWLQVFDSVMIDRVIATFDPEEQKIFFFRYSESEGWQPSTREHAADAPYFDLHSDAPWPGCPAGAGAVACLELKK
ncbi:MAG TPA: class I SAM-dependent methyltransferase [Candidatus Angelobacter sp.]|nr:class I SAM-dependent methyltransferase [Candidatus Angelobacter sp.]